MSISLEEQYGLSNMSTTDSASEGDKEKARLVVCANAQSTDEAALFMRMLGLL